MEANARLSPWKLLSQHITPAIDYCYSSLSSWFAVQVINLRAGIVASNRFCSFAYYVKCQIQDK